MKKILILFGGNSYEHLISCKSAKTILTHIDRKQYQITSTIIDKDNTWYEYDDEIKYLETWKERNIIKINNIIDYLKQFDKVFPIIHGNPVENGNLQGLFNLFGIKYVGTDLSGSIIGYDKELTKIICNHHNIPQVPYQVITKKEKNKNINIEYPVIIKPAKCGSSIGINIANNQKELTKYINEAYKYDDKVIIEKYIKSREFECAILETKKLIISDIGEIRSSNDFYDYESKYILDSKLIIPANINKELKKEIQDLSSKIFKILNLKNLSRIDFLYDYNNNKLYFNEVNTMPGFTDISMYPLLLKEKGIPIKELITNLIEY
ncbi:MAG: D-alanine--D-alanine ligase [Bacilli bacterium]|nr:D-alanine--D-alanine ligase [Bacilli bacterium]